MVIVSLILIACMLDTALILLGEIINISRRND